MANKSDSCQPRYKRQRSMRSLNEPNVRRSGMAIQSQLLILILLPLLMIYMDSRSITACIVVVNDRPITMDLQRYVSSIVDAITSVNHGAPALLRGSRSTSNSETYEHSVPKETKSMSNVIHKQPLSKLPKRNEMYAESKNKHNTQNKHGHENDNVTTGTQRSQVIKTKEHEPSVSAASGQHSKNANAEHFEHRDSSKHIQNSYSNSNGDTYDPTTQATDMPSTQDNNHFNDSESKDKELVTVTKLEPNNLESEIHMHRAAPTTRPKILCLSGESYGRTMNQFLQLATILHELGVNGTTLVAFKNPLFTSFYEEWLEPRDDIIASYDEDAPCDAEYDAATLHYLYFVDKWKDVAYQFKTLMPKATIREQAESVLKEYAGPSNLPVTTVHRRDLEGACVLFADEKNLIACPNLMSSEEMSTENYRNSCLIDYPMIANEANGSNVVLCTDGQVPALDETFPTISNHSFPIQSWMMTISDVHYGNAFSTVDLVVYFWRMALKEKNGSFESENVRMQPSACYKATPVVA
jgi:hypothetical protein